MKQKETAFTVNEIAKMYNLTVRTLQFYDDIGLLKAKRLENNYRVYDQLSLYTLDTIVLLKNCGLELDEIMNYLYKADKLQQEDILETAKVKLQVERKRIEHSLNRIDHRMDELKKLSFITPNQLFEAERNKHILEYKDKELFKVSKGNVTSYHLVPMDQMNLISILDKDGNFIKAAILKQIDYSSYEKIVYCYFPYENNFKEIFFQLVEMTKGYKIKDGYYQTVPVLTENNVYYHYFECLIDE